MTVSQSTSCTIMRRGGRYSIRTEPCFPSAEKWGREYTTIVVQAPFKKMSGLCMFKTRRFLGLFTE